MKKTRRTSFLLAFIMIISILGYSFASTSFKDVTGTWCSDFVADLYLRKVVHGYPDGLYHPTDDVTRGAISKMLILAMKSAGSGIQEDAKDSPFQDTEKHWAENSIVPLTKQDIIIPSEYKDGFKPDQPMSRVETIKTIVRAYLYAHPEESLPTDSKLVFTDADRIAKNDLPYVQKGVELKIIDGYEDGSFRPNDSIQRSTAAAMMSRFIDAVGRISDKLAPPSDTRVDGKVDTNKTAPEIKNVEWVLKPTIKIPNDRRITNFSKFAPDGMSSFWDNDDLRDPTFIDLKGNTHTFKGTINVGEFVQGLAPAVDAKIHKWGYIDFAGNWVCPPELDRAYNIEKYYLTDGSIRYYGTAIKNDVQGSVGLDGKFVDDWEGTVDIEKTCGPKITPPERVGEFSLARPTKAGLFAFEERLGPGKTTDDDYFGICDRNGKVLLKPTYVRDSTKSLHSTYSSADVYDDCIVLTHRLTLQFDCIKDVYDGTTGKLIFSMYNTPYGSPELNISGYGQGLFSCFIREGNDVKYGFMKPDGTEVIPTVFESVRAFSNGYAWVRIGGLWGIIKLPTF